VGRAPARRGSGPVGGFEGAWGELDSATRRALELAYESLAAWRSGGRGGHHRCRRRGHPGGPQPSLRPARRTRRARGHAAGARGDERIRRRADRAGSRRLHPVEHADRPRHGRRRPGRPRGHQRSVADRPAPPDGTASSPPPPPAPPAPKDGSHPPGEGRLGHRRLLWASRSIWWPGRPAGSRCRRGDLPRGIVRGVMSRLARQLLHRYEPHRMD
jgi:hypothetical protein